MAKTIDDTFSLLLLEELGTMTALIGMSSYAMLTVRFINTIEMIIHLPIDECEMTNFSESCCERPDNVYHIRAV